MGSSRSQFILLALLATACGGDDGDAQPATVSTSSAETGAPDPSSGTTSSETSAETVQPTTAPATTTASADSSSGDPISTDGDSGTDTAVDPGPAPQPLFADPFEDTALTSRGWERDLASCIAVPDETIGHPVIQCSFVEGSDPPVGGTDGANWLMPAGVTEYTLKFKQRVSAGIVLGDQTLHGFMMMSNKGVHSPANSYGSMYFDPSTSSGYEGEWVFVFQDNKALNCEGGTNVDLFASTEDRSAGGCQTPTEHHPDDALSAWCWGDACSGGLETYTGQSGWTMQPNVARPIVPVDQWVEFTYYIRLNTPGQFDGVAWMTLKRPDDPVPLLVIDTAQLMMRAGGWNADMTIDKLFFGPWASSNSYTFDASFADIELYDTDLRPWLDWE